MKLIKNYLFLIKDFLRFGKKYFILLLIFSLLSPIATVMDTFMLKEGIDNISSENGIEKMIFFLVVYLALAILLYLLGAIFAKYSSVEQIKIGNRMNAEIYKKAIETDYAHCDSPGFYDVYSWTIRGYFSHSLAAVKNLVGFFSIILNIFVVISIIATVDSVVIIFSFINLFVVMFLNIITKNVNYRREEELLLLNRSNSYINRIFYVQDYAMDIRITGLGRIMLEQLELNKEERISISKKYLEKNLRITFLTKLIPTIIYIITIFYLVWKTSNGANSYGEFALLLSASQNLTNELLNFSSYIPNVIEHGLVAKKIVDFYSMESHIENANGGKKLQNFPPKIVLKNISFQYDNSEKKIISDCTINIGSKEKIAIVGDNGVGKTTILKLLLRLYDVNDGNIMINDVDISEYDVHQMRNNIGIVTQRNNVYAMSLQNNLFIDDNESEASETDINRIIGMLDVKDLYANSILTKEFDDHGRVLSEGEKQKVALMRLMLNNYPLILLDEPTSSLDPISEREFMEILTNDFENSTIVMVAHKLSTIKNFNQIYVMDNGTVIEHGTHDQLMSIKGKYYHMYSTQAKMYN